MHGTQVKLSNGEMLPTFKEYLQEGMKQTKTKLICEIKPSSKYEFICNQIYKIVKAQKAENQLIYIGFDLEICKKMVALLPKNTVQYLNGDKSAHELKSLGITGADYYYSKFTNDPDLLIEFKKMGINTNAWTVNDSLTMALLYDRKIDFITTDMPELAFNELKKVSNRKLIWSDEFNTGSMPDTLKWNFEKGGEGFGNNELQYYVAADSQTVQIKNGILSIRALKQKHEKNDYISTKLVSKGKREFTYGKFEVRAKLPKGRGSWPAIWMLSKDINEKGWPLGGEIDIMENVGFSPDTLVGSVHTQSYNHIIGTQKTKRILNKNAENEFHVYGIDWSKEKIDFLLDDKIYLTVKNEHKTEKEWPFFKPFYLILNLAVGGNWGGMHGVDDAAFPMQMDIDYVRVYE